MFAQSLALLLTFGLFGHHSKPIDNFSGHPPIHSRARANAPSGMSAAQIKSIYHLTTAADAGKGKTIAIIDAYDDPNISTDLHNFSAAQGLPDCTTANGCLTKVKLTNHTSTSWALEEALDVEWAHAIAPGAKIILVEARSNSGNDLLAAVDYARTQTNADAVSMSWGGGEFAGELSYDSHFSKTGVAFFAASGDNGSSVSWPAVSPNVIGVGGTTLANSGGVWKETAWNLSGGGVSTFETVPNYQGTVNSSSGRGVPDVAYNADPASGFSVLDTFGYRQGWLTVGGTSAGTPQWAAIYVNGGNTATLDKLYAHAGDTSYFNDIITGSNGGFSAHAGYDFVTGLGSPNKTISF